MHKAHLILHSSHFLVVLSPYIPPGQFSKQEFSVSAPDLTLRKKLGGQVIQLETVP